MCPLLQGDCERNSARALRRKQLDPLHHQGCVMRLTDICGWQEEECASPNASRGGFTDRAGREVCKWSNGSWNPACRSAHACPLASLRSRRGLRSCPPQRVVGSPVMVTCPDSRVVRRCAAHGSTPPSVFSHWRWILAEKPFSTPAGNSRDALALACRIFAGCFSTPLHSFGCCV